MSTDSDSQPTYEFSAPQNTVIGSLASFMKVFGIICIVGGVLLILGSLFTAKGLSPDQLQGVFVVIIGVLQHRAARAFRSVATTQGNDIPHQMTALGILRDIYKIQVIVMIAVFLLAIVLGVIVAGNA